MNQYLLQIPKQTHDLRPHNDSLPISMHFNDAVIKLGVYKWGHSFAKQHIDDRILHRL